MAVDEMNAPSRRIGCNGATASAPATEETSSASESSSSTRRLGSDRQDDRHIEGAGHDHLSVEPVVIQEGLVTQSDAEHVMGSGAWHAYLSASKSPAARDFHCRGAPVRHLFNPMALSLPGVGGQ